MPTPSTFTAPRMHVPGDGGLNSEVWVAASAREAVLAERAEHFPLETGGILLGYRRLEENVEHWVITAVTGPGRGAKHRRNRFTPDHDYHRKEAEKHFSAQKGTEYYLGDWHTHPDGAPDCSWIDRRTLFKNACRAGHTADRSLMLIVGGGIEEPSYGAHIGARNSGWWRGQKVRAVSPVFF